jgi:hypothetical protein
MRALYEARLEDLRPGDLVNVECVCGHAELLTASMLASAGVKPHQTILDLQLKPRCRECDVRGKAVVSIRWAAG